MLKRSFRDTFRIITLNDSLIAHVDCTNVAESVMFGRDPYIDYTLSELALEIQRHPIHLEEQFNYTGPNEKHPDIITLKRAYASLEKSIAEKKAATLLPNLLQDRAIEAQIARASHPCANMLDDFLYGTASTPAHPLRQPE